MKSVVQCEFLERLQWKPVEDETDTKDRNITDLAPLVSCCRNLITAT